MATGQNDRELTHVTHVLQRQLPTHDQVSLNVNHEQQTISSSLGLGHTHSNTSLPEGSAHHARQSLYIAGPSSVPPPQNSPGSWPKRPAFDKSPCAGPCSLSSPSYFPSSGSLVATSSSLPSQPTSPSTSQRAAVGSFQALLQNIVAEAAQSIPKAIVAASSPSISATPSLANANGTSSERDGGEPTQNRNPLQETDASPAAGPSGHPDPVSTFDLPYAVARTLSHDSTPTSLDLHPVRQNLLLAGTDVGELVLWELNEFSKWVIKFDKRGRKNDHLPEILKGDSGKNMSIAVNQVRWSQDGSLAGVAYSKNLVEVFSYHGRGDLRSCMQFEAHKGNVNDIAFSSNNNVMIIVTGGDDKLVRVWDAHTGTSLINFAGHEASVHSVLPHRNHILSTSIDGRLKRWSFHSPVARADRRFLGGCCATVQNTNDGKRVFSCGVAGKGRRSILSELKYPSCTEKTFFLGLRAETVVERVHFHLARNLLAVGHQSVIKFWDMDGSGRLLASHDARGGLVTSPIIRFNKGGSLLAATAVGNRIKVLINHDGLWLLNDLKILNQIPTGRSTDTQTRPQGNANRSPPATDEAGPSSRTPPSFDLNSEPPAEDDEGPSTSTLGQIVETVHPGQIRSMRLPIHQKNDKINRLLYHKAGCSLTALSESGQLMIWQWNKLASTKYLPALVEPVGQPNKPARSFDISGDDSGQVSLSVESLDDYDMEPLLILKKRLGIRTSMATIMAIHPKDKDLQAVGMDDDFRIEIIHLTIRQVKYLRGHKQRVTSLAFCPLGNVLVSASADAQVIVWDWMKETREWYIKLPIPENWHLDRPETHIEIFKDNFQILAVHESMLAVFNMNLNRLNMWVVTEPFARISHATLSNTNEVIYAGGMDGTVLVFDTLKWQPVVRISSSAYLRSPNSTRGRLFANVLAAHPHIRSQVALGMSDGQDIILEPNEDKGKRKADYSPDQTDRTRRRSAPQIQIGSSSRSKRRRH